MEESPTRKQFEEFLNAKGLNGILQDAVLLKSIRSIGDAEVYRYDMPDGNAVLIKTYAKSSWLVKAMIGRQAIRREDRNLRLLHALKDIRVPEPYGTPDKDTIACEFLKNASTLQSAMRYDDATMPPKSFFRELVEAIRKMHENRVCHGDLRRGNLMIDSEGRLYIIDVATALHCPEISGPFRKMLFNALCKSDNYSLAKIVESYYPDMMDETLKGFLRKAPWYLRLARFLRHDIYRKLRLKHKHSWRN